MWTTVDLDDDVAAAVDQMRKERGLGTSEAVNELARRRLAQCEISAPRFVQQTSSGGARFDVTDIAGTLDLDELKK